MKKRGMEKSGFTVSELIFVIIILGILAALALPQFSSSTDEAKVATLSGNLVIMRTAVEMYYQQHGSTYPGYIHTDGNVATAGQMEAAFVAQLTQYSDKDGKTSATKDDANFPYGPYLLNEAIPDNPLPDSVTDSTDIATVEADNNADALAATASATKGWRYSVETGQFIANNADYETM
jgi:prepilin-type N-terminal cleavage/methylation domain-containing protein